MKDQQPLPIIFENPTNNPIYDLLAQDSEHLRFIHQAAVANQAARYTPTEENIAHAKHRANALVALQQAKAEGKI
jgi:hypothetical protein